MCYAPLHIFNNKAQKTNGVKKNTGLKNFLSDFLFLY